MLPTRYASFLKRLVAHFLDVMIAWGISAIFLVPLALFLVGGGIFSGLIGGLNWHPGYQPDPEDILRLVTNFLPSIGLIILIVAAATFIYWFYFAIFESSPRQATPGKMLMGIFVTDLEGRRLTFPRALGRILSKILSKMFCYIGYLIALFTERNQGLHDMIAGTLVLEPSYPAPSVENRGSAQPPQPPLVTYPGGAPAGSAPTIVVPPAQAGPEKPEEKPDKNSTGS